LGGCEEQAGCERKQAQALIGHGNTLQRNP
jgi:hypothetical protein